MPQDSEPLTPREAHLLAMLRKVGAIPTSPPPDDQGRGLQTARGGTVGTTWEQEKKRLGIEDLSEEETYPHLLEWAKRELPTCPDLWWLVQVLPGLMARVAGTKQPPQGDNPMPETVRASIRASIVAAQKKDK